MTQEQTEEEVVDLPFIDVHDKKSLYNKMPRRLKDLLKEIDPTLLTISEERLEKLADPTWIEDQLRSSFWMEYNMSLEDNRRMQSYNFYKNICTREHFYFIIQNQHKLAWIIRPPQNYALAMGELLDRGLRRYREILKMPLYRDDGKPNLTLINQIVKITETINTRLNGAPVQKLQMQSHHIHTRTDEKKEPKDVTALEDEVALLENKIKQLREPNVSEPRVIEATKAEEGSSTEED